MIGDISDVDTLLRVQGDRVTVHARHKSDGHTEDYVLTLVHVVDVDSRELRLVNRDAKSRLPDWHVGQALADAMQPAGENKVGAKWKVSIKI